MLFPTKRHLEKSSRSVLILFLQKKSMHVRFAQCKQKPFNRLIFLFVLLGRQKYQKLLAVLLTHCKVSLFTKRAGLRLSSFAFQAVHSSLFMRSGVMASLEKHKQKRDKYPIAFDN